MKKLFSEVEVKLLYKLGECFPKSFVNSSNEFIVNPRINSYFRLDNIENELELDCKILEYVSRPSYKGGTRHTHKYHLDGLNMFLETDFNEDEIRDIYSSLGNGCNRDLCIKFIESDFNFKLLEER